MSLFVLIVLILYLLPALSYLYLLIIPRLLCRIIQFLLFVGQQSSLSIFVLVLFLAMGAPLALMSLVLVGFIVYHAGLVCRYVIMHAYMRTYMYIYMHVRV